MELEDKIARVADILEHIEETNKMLDFHLNHAGDLSTIEQYQYIRKKYTTELSELLQSFRLTPRFAELAA